MLNEVKEAETARGRQLQASEAAVIVLQKKGINMTNWCGIATDGAAAMLPSTFGVVTKLKTDFPGILPVHCIAHRISLGYGGAVGSIPYLLKLQEIVNAL